MRLILDTHILIWTLSRSRALSTRATDLLLEPSNEKLASTVSVWEIAIKFGLGRGGAGEMPFGAAKTTELIEEAGLRILPITPHHARAVEALPRLGHGDPFDRMLIAQAIDEGSLLITHDTALAAYGERVLLV